MNAALYIRVSTDDQLEFSPDAQKRAMIEYAKRNDMLVSDEHIYIDEGISGKRAKNRPAFQRMIATAKSKQRPFDVILVHKFDRFARSREDSVVYKSLLKRECNVKVVSITEQLEDDKFSVILEAMLEAMAEYYSLNLSDEVMKGMTEKARRGQLQYASPFGYNIKNGNVTIIEHEANIVKLIFDKFVNEKMTYVEICHYLNEHGLRNRKGNMFQTRFMKYVLENPIYCGMVRWNYSTQKGGTRRLKKESEWIITNGNHEAIVDKEIFNKAQKQISHIKSLYSTPNIDRNQYGHWLGGLLRCSTCGGTLTISNAKLKFGGYYVCNRNRKGSCPTANRVRIDIIQEEIINALKHDLYMLEKVPGTPISIESKKINDSEITLLEAQLEKVKRKYAIAKNAYLAEIDSLEEYKANKNAIQEEENNLLDKLNKISKPQKDNSKYIKKKIKESLNLIDDSETELKVKNEMLKSFIKEIVVNKEADTIDIHYFS